MILSLNLQEYMIKVFNGGIINDYQSIQMVKPSSELNAVTFTFLSHQALKMLFEVLKFNFITKPQLKFQFAFYSPLNANYHQTTMIRLQAPYQPYKSQPNDHISQLRHNPQAQLNKNDRGDNYGRATFGHEVNSWKEIELESYGDYLDMQSQGFSSEKGIVTDRFIPARKHLKLDPSPFEAEQKPSNENSPPTPPTDPSTLSLADIYRKCIMTQPKKSIKIQSHIQQFRNNNCLKFQRQSITQGQCHEQFQFTTELVASIKSKRKLAKMPFKVLDAPALQDDFYLNLIDWGQQNFLAVGLASNVYLWNGINSKVTKLCDLGLSDTVTAVGWAKHGNTFTVGTNNGEVHLWDVAKLKKVRVMHGHSNRVGSISWSSSILSTGSRDKTILHRDPRSPHTYISKLVGHKQQICGLRWSPDEQQLCSGGNDNKVMIWNMRAQTPILKFSDHLAAVKAVAWSPHQHGLLASGGGTADRHIRFRNTLTGQTIKTIDTGSQVCNLTFSKTVNQLVSTHGYSFNEINIWKYPKMEKVGTLMGHTMRVLYLTMSPDGSTIVTGAGDQTLRFWNVFPSNRDQRGNQSQLNMQTVNLR